MFIVPVLFHNKITQKLVGRILYYWASYYDNQKVFYIALFVQTNSFILLATWHHFPHIASKSAYRASGGFGRLSVQLSQLPLEVELL